MNEPPVVPEAQQPDPTRSAHLKLERSASGKIGWSVSITMGEWAEAFAALQAADAALQAAYGGQP